MLTAITGINWGDEGKGRMVDLISQEYDIVARYQGGNNAGHTVKNERGKFVLNLLPSGILRPNVVCVMGNGMVIDPHHLDGEINKLREQGIDISPANLKISDRATITSRSLASPTKLNSMPIPRSKQSMMMYISVANTMMANQITEISTPISFSPVPEQTQRQTADGQGCPRYLTSRYQRAADLS